MSEKVERGSRYQAVVAAAWQAWGMSFSSKATKENKLSRQGVAADGVDADLYDAFATAIQPGAMMRSSRPGAVLPHLCMAATRPRTSCRLRSRGG